MNWLRQLCYLYGGVRQLFCLHDWRETSHSDYMDIVQAAFGRDDGSRLRRTLYECRKCGKSKITERLVRA